MDKQIALKRLVGDNIRSLRNAQGLSQEQLGERSGLSYKFLGEVERGTVNPSLESLEKIAGALNIETFNLLLRSGLAVVSDNDVANAKSALDVLNNLIGSK